MNDTQRFPDFEHAVSSMLTARKAVPAGRSLVVGVSTIDGAGKGYFTAKLIERLRRRSLNAIGINVDGWLNLPHVRFNTDNSAEHFYEHALRFDEMFEKLILPLKAKRSHRVVADFAEETASAYRKHKYAFEHVDVRAQSHCRGRPGFVEIQERQALLLVARVVKACGRTANS